MANVLDIKNLGPEVRYAGELPKIGIRPTIDGRRRGVRESLEVQTMNPHIVRRSSLKRMLAPL